MADDAATTAAGEFQVRGDAETRVAELEAEVERLTKENERLNEDEMERPDWDDKVAKAQMLEYANDRAEAAEESARTAWNVHAEHVETMNVRLLHEASVAADWKARLDALVADLRGLADRFPVLIPVADICAVLDKHAGEQAQGGNGRG